MCRGWKITLGIIPCLSSCFEIESGFVIVDVIIVVDDVAAFFFFKHLQIRHADYLFKVFLALFILMAE